MFSDLRGFLDHLRRDRDLIEISAPVDPVLEAAEIHRRVIAAGGRLGGYSQLSLKRALLAAEGLEVTLRRVRHFPLVRWTGTPVRRARR